MFILPSYYLLFNFLVDLTKYSHWATTRVEIILILLMISLKSFQLLDGYFIYIEKNNEVILLEIKQQNCYEKVTE